MPEAMERALEATLRKGKKRKWSKERKDRYKYGAMRAAGWKPSRER